MTKIPHLTDVKAYLVKAGPAFGSWISVVATGESPTSGWTSVRLEQLLLAIWPPADGLLNLAFMGDPPVGMAAQHLSSVSASLMVRAFDGCRGVRVFAAGANSMEADFVETHIAAASALEHKAQPYGHVIVSRELGAFEDSFQPTGRTKFGNWKHPVSAEMKKLHHDLVLVVEGPDEGKIHSCVNEAVAAGLIAAIAAAFATGGAALPAAIAAFLASLEECLGAAYTARVDNSSHWEYWWT